MRRLSVLTAAIVLWIALSCPASLVYARSESLTSTIIITVRERPQLNLLPKGSYSGMVKEPAIGQSSQDVTPSDERPYTIIDQL